MRPLRPPVRPMAWLALALGACSPGDPEVDLSPPPDFVRDIGPSEEACIQLEAHLAEALLDGLRRGDAAQVRSAFTPGFSGWLPAPADWRAVPDSLLTIGALRPGWDRGRPAVDPDAATDYLLDLARELGELRRTELEVHGFWLAQTRSSAILRLELRLAGAGPGEARRDRRLTCSASAVLASGTWRLDALRVDEGTDVSASRPLYREVTGEVGFSFHDSRQNRERLQAFVNEHRTFALGGLTALDANGDGFWDIAATRRKQDAVLFRNDGAGGFIPEPLPTDLPSRCGSFLLFVDLDGDGSPELLPSQVQGFEGDSAWLDLYTRVNGEWKHLPRALEFNNPRGLRRLAIQTLVPFDADRDGDLDVFVAVYGSMLSRGEDYNTVEAHDGADNHLFLTGPGLAFEEASEDRGISGTQYTYVATAFDFDGDGDPDLFEGNDFGSNRLWLNDGSGRFSADENLGFSGVPAYTMGATLADFDGSGRWALYVSNMSSEQGLRILPLPEDLSPDSREKVASIAQGNMLYIEDPSTGRWAERGMEMHCNEGEWAWASSFFDPDGDGDRDLFVTNGFASHEDSALPDWQTFYWRQVVADAGFLERGERSQDVNNGQGAPGSFNGYERDRLYHLADGDGDRFFEAGFVYGLDADHDGRCAVPLDMDGDGDQDLALWTLGGLRMFENTSDPRPFIRLGLVATRTHPAALGAVVTVRAGDRQWRDVVRLVDGFQTQIPPDLHFGLGHLAGHSSGMGKDHEAVDTVSVTVAWPSGEEETWDDVPLGLRTRLTEGALAFEARAVPAWKASTRPRGLEQALTRSLTAPLQPSQPRSPNGPDGEPVVPVEAGRPTIVSILGPDGTAPIQTTPGESASPASCNRIEFALPGTPIQTDDPGILHLDQEAAMVIGPPGDPAGPQVLLFDSEARLARWFRRPIEPGELEAFLERLTDEPGFPDLTVLTARRALDQGEVRRAEQLLLEALEAEPGNALAHEGLARVATARGRLDLAEKAYADAVTADPDYGLGYLNLGVTRTQLGRPVDAIPALTKAVEILGDQSRALLALAEALLLSRDLEGSLSAFRRAAAARPDDPARALNVAKLLGQLRRLEEAREAYLGVLEIDPTSSEARRGLARVEVLLGDGD